ncbi:methyltransferase domain-containing protein [Clostridium estertheticum]|uniref:class I SAM-dependent methyltransferase n=1 Tax=Clostridium estertheticum TaxID=238834 RepID=UPI001CF15FF6|nr:class I SAM-dependent methyltransferase [Clostridium estertheticum]MCB2309138.1 methyltransferase domain-containing protein [Clostridium estertheticum]MCB2344870.1 methyltransferase domain-containing protein [Clostridium estertheticum]MCB2349964.1 methyltransferase domain-containing protein [Clostridium estertheticum]WAG48272.1 methyltransferase domain-containing protein [Clostridium estertheticum]
MKLEEMSSFFNNRADWYEEHMMNNVDGADKYYIETAKLIPKINGLKVLDLGCGTGLELDEIFKKNPTVMVTGVDLAKDMMEKIKLKHSDKLNQLNLIVDSYFSYDMGESVFDVALSVETLHHFNHEEKTKLYKKIFKSLKQNGFYVETDYTAPNQDSEDFNFNENKRIRSELGITDGFYHYDTPCTVENQMQMLYNVGFKSVEKMWQHENTTILLAIK